MAEFKPLYRKTLEHARVLGEILQWRESRKENIACARAIDKAIAEGYDGMHLREGIPAEIVQQFGMDRVAWVLAATLHEKEYDGRFTYGNKVWGEAQRISHDSQAYEYCCNAHPVLVNDLIDDFRKLQREAVQAPEALRIRIFQINHDRDPERHKFQDLEHLGGKPIDAASYDRVFTGEIPGKSLEDVFQVFNTGGHRLHRGHSLSVSDVVELRDPAGDTPAGFYYCDSVGFHPVDFDPDKAQVPDRLCRILVLEPHRRPYESELVDELSNLQRAVGGLIAIMLEPMFQKLSFFDMRSENPESIFHCWKHDRFGELLQLFRDWERSGITASTIHRFVRPIEWIDWKKDLFIGDEDVHWKVLIEYDNGTCADYVELGYLFPKELRRIYALAASMNPKK